jgi:long-subunit fatty acid transport protein
VGLAVNAPFGLATEWDNTWAGQFHAIRSEIETLNINPTVSFKVNNMISLGAGVSYQQIKAELTNAVPSATGGACGTLPCAIASPATGKVEGDDWAWGWNLGALFDFGQGTRVGLTYRSTSLYAQGNCRSGITAARSGKSRRRQVARHLLRPVAPVQPAVARPCRLHLDRLGLDQDAGRPEPGDRHDPHQHGARVQE